MSRRSLAATSHTILPAQFSTVVVGRLSARTLLRQPRPFAPPPSPRTRPFFQPARLVAASATAAALHLKTPAMAGVNDGSGPSGGGVHNAWVGEKGPGSLDLRSEFLAPLQRGYVPFPGPSCVDGREADIQLRQATP